MMHPDTRARRGGGGRVARDHSTLSMPAASKGYFIFIDGDQAVMATPATLEEVIVGQLGSIVEQFGGKRAKNLAKTWTVERKGPTCLSFTAAGVAGGPKQSPVGLVFDAGSLARSVMIELAKRPEPPHDIAVKTATEVFSELVHSSGEKHETFRREAIDNLTTFFARRNHGSDPQVLSTAMIEENGRRRGELIASEPMLTARQVQELAGHKATNASATASRWKASGKLFALAMPDGDLFPAFQFADDKPHPAVARVLGALPDTMTDWQVAFWFTSSNPVLDLKRPADCLGDADKVVAAAEREALQLAG